MKYIDDVDHAQNQIEDIEYVSNPGQVIAIIGESLSGPRLEPVYAMDEKHVASTFKDGGLVNAYRAVEKNGGNNIYLVRIDHTTEREKYHEYMYAYEVLQALDIDIILPLDFSLMDNIVDYPEFFVKQEALEIEAGKQEYQLSHPIENVEYIKYMGTRTKRFEVTDEDKIKFTFVPENQAAGSDFTVKYYRVPTLDIEFTVRAFRGPVQQKQESFTYEFDIRDGISQATEDNVIDYLIGENHNKEYYTDPGWRYQVTTEQNFVSMFYRPSGNTPIHFTFDYDEYINRKTEEKYFVEKLAEYCGYLNAQSFVQFDRDSDNPISDINKIKRILNSKEIQYGRYITTTPSIIDYGDFQGWGSYALAGLCGKYQSHEPITNKPIDSSCEIVTEFSDVDRSKLSRAGFAIFYNTIRNGKVPYTALTLAEDGNPYKVLKVARTMNEMAKRIVNSTDEYAGFGISYIASEIDDIIRDVLQSMTVEGKILAASFESNIDYDKGEVNVRVFTGMEGELQKIKNSVTAEIFSETDFV